MSGPNLLFIFTDEQRADTLGCYGNDRIETPNLDCLASSSTLFERAYVTQPVCTPSRSTIMTGLYPHSNGCTANNIPLPADVLCLPEMLPAGEYVSAYHGKWHLGDEVFRQHGFDEWVSIEDGYAGHYSEGRDGETKSTYFDFLSCHGFSPENGVVFSRSEAARLPEQYGKPAFLAEQASRFIKANRDRRFALFVNFLEPHMPFFGPRDEQYDPAQVRIPANVEAYPGQAQHLKSRLLRRHFQEKGFGGEVLRTAVDWRRLIARYWGLCSLVDTHVGTILRSLDDCGLMQDTVVVYTSDHGDMMASHGLLAKCVMYEEAVRVPLLVRAPGHAGPRRVAAPISQVDLVPTLLELMGQPGPASLQGVSTADVLGPNGRAGAGRDVFIEWNGPDSGLGRLGHGGTPPAHLLTEASPELMRRALNDPLRTVVSQEGWKLTLSTLGQHELYNLNDDPFECRNLANASEQRPVRHRLAQRIRAWQRQTGDAAELPAEV